MKKISCLFGKTMTGLLFLILMAVGRYLLSTEADLVYAAEVNEVYAEQLDISNYKTKVPKSSDADHKDWVFAGWYEESTCKTAIMDKTSVSGKYYAKFVPTEVLSIKCQVSASTKAEDVNNSDAVSKIRIVSTVDSLHYSAVGFKIEIGKNSYYHETTTVYSSIVSQDADVKFTHTPSQFNSSSQYFVTATIINIPSSAFSVGIRITPYWTTLDGTQVYGVGRYSRVEDSYLNIVNVPIRLSSDMNAAAGRLAVDYNEEIFEYYGWDSGTVFDEMKVSVGTEDTNKVIRCLGNSTVINSKLGNVIADGMYVNLRFQIKSNATLPNTSTFAVFDEEFCDKNEVNIVLDISDAIYINMN